MGRSSLVSSVAFVALLIFQAAGLAGCGNSNAVRTTNFPVPASVSITPNPNLSMEIGTNQAFSAGSFNATGGAITEPIFFQSSNTAVVTVANNGLACAGSWDSLNNPQICTPGPVGVAQITATAQGVSSPPTTVYVHQHIDKIVVAEIPPPPPNPPPPPGCSSVGKARYYAATAYSRGADITSSVGIFNWQAVPTSVVTMSTTAAGLLPGQVQATAKVPGLTSVFATIGTANSVPTPFATCAVQSIALTVTSSTGTSKTITPTVVDTVGQTINGVPLTWSSSEPASATVSSNGGVTAATAGGTSTIVASCTPPTCNIAFYPSLPIYGQDVVTMTATGTAKSGTVYVSSTSCGTTDGCFSMIVPITTPANTLGTFLTLPATPDSLVFNRQGTKAYLGTNSGLLGSVGLAVLDAAANAITPFTGLPGKVLAISPDGNRVIISDTAPADGPNRVFVFDATSRSSVTFQITGATAADFSPDSLKAYIVAGSTLYVYSKLDALRTIPLPGSAVDVAFLANGIFGYMAGPSGITFRPTCDDPYSPVITTVAGAQGAAMIHALPDGATMLTVASPNIQTIAAAVTGNPVPPLVVGCPIQTLGGPAFGFLTVTNTVNPPFNLGQGNFVPKQLIVSQDGSTAYLVTSNLSSILVFNIAGQTSSAIPLAGNANPLTASLTPDGTLLYVGASDGTLHVVDTVAGGDIQQISFAPTSLCQNSVGKPAPVTCLPDLVAVRP
jgi:hypothetical protein